MKQLKYKLCYVRGSFAYFTSQDMNKQTGDLWDHSDYKYASHEPDESPEGLWEIYKVAYTGAHELDFYNSVQDINAGKAPWLYYKKKGIDGLSGTIEAGITLADFIDKISEVGEVFIPVVFEKAETLQTV